MFEDWNWTVEVRPWNHVEVGRVTIATGVEFIVHKWNNAEGFSKDFRIGYSVTYRVLGCEGQSLTMVSREQVEAYLERQKKLASEYIKIKGKRDAIRARTEPLQRKYSLLNDQIFLMVKS